ncbi:MAG: tRNA guanosine(34) transglycosylase Tgt [Candidatus Babeliales bacterium]
MDTHNFSFTILHTSSRSRARVGIITTPHGIIETPAFVAVGTNGTLKALDPVNTEKLGLQLMFCNTLHLMLQPGPSLIKKAGGLHAFMQRTTPIITDSGGFQIFSFPNISVHEELKSKGKKRTNNSSCLINITEEGVTFRSYRDGTRIMLTPESSVQAQKDFGSDIIIPLDELPPYHTSRQQLITSLERTHRWEKRSLDYHRAQPQNQAIFGVIHGGIEQDLRMKSCTYLTSLAFDGFAIGGSLGKNREEMLAMLTYTMPMIPSEKPCHLLGIGDLPSLQPCIQLGVDTFDSSHPTKCARHGLLFTQDGPLKITHRDHRDSFLPLDKDCPCFTCTQYTRAYLHHLFKAKELTAYTLATIHNIAFMIGLMKHYRKQILNDEL